MRVRVYVDGFNLFYGALKAKIKPEIDLDTKNRIKEEKKILRWLDLNKLVKEFVKGENVVINKINFYTADIKPRSEGDKSPLNQQEYYKALNSFSNIKICKGRYDSHSKSLPIYPLTNPLQFATVLNSEEKGSDVNFASHLVFDACKDEFDMAVIITNDSDLLEPIKIACQLGKKILILCPHSYINNDFLINFDTKSLRKISAKNIKNSQLDDVIYSTEGNIIAQRPDYWKPSATNN